VARNHVKRRVREWFRATRATLPANVDVVVIAKPGAAELGSAGIRDSLQRALASPPRAQRRAGRSRRA
jgi:ribonuclease P protein component